MHRSSKLWDIRCPRELVNMFPVRRGYYYKVDRVQARLIVRILSRAYRIKAAIKVSNEGPDAGCNGQCYYLPNGASRIHVHARGHMKTVFHEWYHALDHATGGMYNSSDRQGGPSSLAWQFADRLFDMFRIKKPN